MSNVIDFSSILKQKRDLEIEAIAIEQDALEALAGDFALSAMLDVIEALEEMGFDLFNNPDCIRDVLAGVESIRAMIYRIHGEKTAFQKISDDVFDEIEDTKTVLSNFLDEFSN